LTFKLSDTETGETFLGDDGSDGVLEFSGADIIVAEEGHFKIDVNTFTFEYTAIEQSWGIIGSAIPVTGWNSDHDMAYLGDGKWEISTDTLSVGPIVNGQFKFRPNDTWDPLNYGDDAPADGIPDEYGANINITAGNWKITLDLAEYPYQYSVVQIVE
jgi:hypothetical protein